MNMDNIIDSKILKYVLIGLLALLIGFILISFPNKHINNNEQNVVSVR